MTAFTYRPQPWMDRALCATQDHDPDLWFPTETGSRAQLQIRAAKAVCGDCPVRTPCLRAALKDPSLAGIWGGKTETERKTINRRSTCA